MGVTCMRMEEAFNSDGCIFLMVPEKEIGVKRTQGATMR